MKVNSINNVSFGAKKTKAEKEAGRNKYFTYVSQFQANEALKMSSGREVQDGKYKLASAITMLAGFFGTCASMIASSNIGMKANTLRATGELTEKAVSKLGKQAVAATAGMLLSTASVLASVVISDVNKAKANKTANERGFLSDRDYRKINDKETAYAVTDFVNKVHTV